MENETPGPDAAATPLTGEALQTKVQETLESLLSKKNLVRDQFLAGNMNPQMYIPIRVLMAHEKMAALAGVDEETVAQAATRSAKLGIDDAKSMVRPLLKSKRNVIILRDMPDNTTQEEVKAIFTEGPFADKLASVKAEVNNTWFVKFNLDEGTQDVVLWLRSQQFQGKPVNASIKSEHFLRSFYPIEGQPGPPIIDPNMNQMGFQMDGGMGMPGMMYPAGPEYMVEGIGPMGYDGGGKGNQWGGMPMMNEMMAPGPQPPGSWQPWGQRHQPPPMILPLKYPEKVEPKEGDPAPAEKGKGKGGGKGEDQGGEKKWGNEKWGNDSWGSGDKWGANSWSNNNKWGGGGGGGGKGGYQQADGGGGGKGKGKATWGGYQQAS